MRAYSKLGAGLGFQLLRLTPKAPVPLEDLLQPSLLDHVLEFLPHDAGDEVESLHV